MNVNWNSSISEKDLKDWQVKILKLLDLHNLPKDLIDVFKESNGFVGDKYVFYSSAESLIQNDLLEVPFYAPGFIAIANDGGSRVALLNINSNKNEVFLNYMGDMSVNSMEETGMHLSEWITAGCPFNNNESRNMSAIERVIVRLDKVPSGGLPEIIRIKKICNLVTSLADLRSMINSPPVDLCIVTYIRGIRIASELNQREGYVSLRKFDEPNEILPITKIY